MGAYKIRKLTVSKCIKKKEMKYQTNKNSNESIKKKKI